MQLKLGKLCVWRPYIYIYSSSGGVRYISSTLTDRGREQRRRIKRKGTPHGNHGFGEQRTAGSLHHRRLASWPPLPAPARRHARGCLHPWYVQALWPSVSWLPASSMLLYMMKGSHASCVVVQACRRSRSSRWRRWGAT
jgi:hypothetical protein